MQRRHSKTLLARPGWRPDSSTTTSTPKEDLLLEVVVVTEREMLADWKAVVEAVEDPLERIVTGLDHAEARCADQPEFFRLLLDLYTVSLSSPALRVRCAALRTHLIDEVEIEVRQVSGACQRIRWSPLASSPARS